MSCAHIAFFMNSLMLGGAERVILTLARALLARGTHRVDLVLASRGGPLVAEIPGGMRVIELGLAWPPAVWSALLSLRLPTARILSGQFIRRKPPKAVRSLPRLVRYLRDERPDGLLTTLPYNNLAALWAAFLAGTSTRIVVREANMLSKEVTESAKSLEQHLPALACAWYPRASGIVAVSDGVAQDLCELIGLPRQRIITIHNPVDFPRITALAEEPVDDDWFRPGRPPVVAAVGRLYPQKDYPTLLRAFAEVRAAREARLVIFGEGPDRPSLEALARSLGITKSLRMPGPVANPFAYIRRAAAFVLSSAWEGFPNVLAEALTCGCPVVSTDCPSGPAELLEGGRWGRLVPVSDHRALAEAIMATLDEPRDSERLRRRAGELSLDHAIDRYLDLLTPLQPASGSMTFRS